MFVAGILKHRTSQESFKRAKKRSNMHSKSLQETFNEMIQSSTQTQNPNMTP